MIMVVSHRIILDPCSHAMMPPMSMIFFHLVVLLSVTAAQEAVITIPPQSVNTTLNKVAVFNCTGVANAFTWRANGQQLDRGEGVTITPVALVNETLQIRTLTLRMTVTSVENATNITCTALRWIPLSSDKSHPAMLLVQGLLESVSNLTAAFINSTTVLITWSPPFTLEGVPILGYNVTITNTISEENETMSVEGNTTMLYYSIDCCDSDNLTVTVVPINELGAGEPAVLQISPDTLDPEDIVTSHNLISTGFTSILNTSNGALQFSISTPAVTVLPTENYQTPSFMIMVVSCVVVLLIIVIAVSITVITCCLAFSKKRKTSLSLNKIPVDDNPAYEEVTLKQTHQFEVQENCAYSSYNPYSIID